MPPDAVTVAVALAPALQLTGVLVADAVSGVGCVKVTVATFAQPRASVTVTVCVPAVKPVAVAVACPLLQRYVKGAIPPPPAEGPAGVNV